MKKYKAWFALATVIIVIFFVIVNSPAHAPTKDTDISPTSQNEANITQVDLYFVALEDNGKTGKKIGCGDSVVATKKELYISQDPLVSTLNALLAEKDTYSEKTGLYNGLRNSSLTLYRVAKTETTITVYLKGELSLGGVCDSPRVEAQLEDTIRQFEPKKTVVIYINNKLLKEVLSGKGE